MGHRHQTTRDKRRRAQEDVDEEEDDEEEDDGDEEEGDGDLAADEEALHRPKRRDFASADEGVDDDPQKVRLVRLAVG